MKFLRKLAEFLRVLSRREKFLAVVTIAVVIELHLLSAFRGIDYGWHWDQHHASTVARMQVENLSLFPTIHYYGSAYTAVVDLALVYQWAPHVWTILKTVEKSPARPFSTQTIQAIRDARTKMSMETGTSEFIFRARGICIILTTLTLLWLYLACRRFGLERAYAVLAVLFVGLSWEMNTYSRHLAIDGIFMQFAALSLLMLAAGFDFNERILKLRYFFWGLVVGALASGTKYQGIALNVTFFALVFFARQLEVRSFDGVPKIISLSRKLHVKLFLLALVVSFFGMLIVNPGIVFDPVRFANDVFWARFDYMQIKPQYPYYVAGFFEHFARNLEYLLLAFPSYFPGLAAVLSAVMLYGMLQVFREDRAKFFVLILFPLLHLTFISSTRLILVRNLLPIVPFFVCFFAFGCSRIKLLIQRRKWVFGTTAAALFQVWVVVNLSWMFYTADTIRDDDTTGIDLQNALTDVAERQNKKIYLSKQVREVVKSNALAIQKVNQSSSFEGSDLTLTYLSEIAKIPCNRPRIFEKVFGQLEVNYQYNANWVGRGLNKRLVLIDSKKIKQAGLAAGV